MTGPLQGIRVIEIAGLGPAPFAAMVLADLGADVVTVDRVDRALPGADPSSQRANVTARGRRSVAVDLKHPDGVAVVHRLAAGADVLIEGFRPGVAERLGIGPDALRVINPRLVVGRMTGWGQDGPLAARAGHDINYVALAGPLAHIGRAGQPPTPPLNLLGDFGGGGLLLVTGVLAALVERSVSGEGQVVDAAMVDGAALLAAPIAPAYTMGYFSAERGTNVLDSGAPYYECYQCADGRWLSVGAIEPQFYRAFVEGLGLDPDGLPPQDDQEAWPTLKEWFGRVIRSRPLVEWIDVYDGIDACVAPVLGFSEVVEHPHIAARGTWVDRDGVVQPTPAPRFDRTPAELGLPPSVAGQHTDEVLLEAGVDRDGISALRAAGAVA